MAADDTRPDALAACQACTPADGIMAGCEVEGTHERHRGTYVHEFGGVGVDVEVSWLAGEPADRDLPVPVDEYPAFRAPTITAAAPAVTSPAPAPAKPPAASTRPGRGNNGRASSSPLAASRETLGRLVRETWVRWAAEQPDPKPSWLAGWDELDAGQREVDMRIGHAVANYALTENAITWGTDCPSCARVLDSAVAERERAERAEAQLATLAEHRNAACAALRIAETQARYPAGDEATAERYRAAREALEGAGSERTGNG